MAAVEAVRHYEARLRIDLDNCVIRAPRAGRQLKARSGCARSVSTYTAGNSRLMFLVADSHQVIANTKAQSASRADGAGAASALPAPMRLDGAGYAAASRRWRRRPAPGDSR